MESLSGSVFMKNNKLNVEEKKMRQKLLAFLVMTVLLLSAAGTSQAILSAVDPGTPPGTYSAAFGFFPQWYQDTSARALDLCLSQTAVGLNGPMCVLLPNPGIF